MDDLRYKYKFLRLIDGQITSEAGACVWTPGAWHAIRGAPELCARGFHCSVRAFDAFSYVRGSIVARVEVDGLSDLGADKEAWQRMRIVQAWRWRKEDSVRLAIVAAEKVLHLYEKRYPHDVACRQAIEAAKAWLENPSASAAADAARAAYAAARAADAAYAAYAAYAAARAADAAYAAYAAADAYNAADAAAYAAADAAYAAYAAADAYNAAARARARAREIGEINGWMEAHIAALEPYAAPLISAPESAGDAC